MERYSELGQLARLQIGGRLQLPKVATSGTLSVEEALARRRSIRDFSSEPLNLSQISQLLWSAQGISSSEGQRTAPSAGATYPLEIYLLCQQGLFHYEPAGHDLVKVRAEDLRVNITEAAFGQEFISDAPIALIFAAVFERTTDSYGERGVRYVHMDIGHAAENLHLQAEALGLGSVPVGAFDDDNLAEVLNLPADQEVLYIVPVGKLVG